MFTRRLILLGILGFGPAAMAANPPKRAGVTSYRDAQGRTQMQARTYGPTTLYNYADGRQAGRSVRHGNQTMYYDPQGRLVRRSSNNSR